MFFLLIYTLELWDSWLKRAITSIPTKTPLRSPSWLSVSLQRFIKALDLSFLVFSYLPYLSVLLYVFVLIFLLWFLQPYSIPVHFPASFLPALIRQPKSKQPCPGRHCDGNCIFACVIGSSDECTDAIWCVISGVLYGWTSWRV